MSPLLLQKIERAIEVWPEVYWLNPIAYPRAAEELQAEADSKYTDEDGDTVWQGTCPGQCWRIGLCG